MKTIGGETMNNDGMNEAEIVEAMEFFINMMVALRRASRDLEIQERKFFQALRKDIPDSPRDVLAEAFIRASNFHNSHQLELSLLDTVGLGRSTPREDHLNFKGRTRNGEFRTRQETEQHQPEKDISA